MPLDQLLACYAANDIHQLINRDKPVGTEIQGLLVIRFHQPQQAFHTVINVHKRAGLLAITPNLDGFSIACKCDLA